MIVRIDHAIGAVHICFAVVTKSSCLARCVLVILERYFSAAVYCVIYLIHEIEGAFICGLGGICEIQMAGIFVRFILALKAHELFDEVAGLSGRNEVRRGNGVDEDLDLLGGDDMLFIRIGMKITQKMEHPALVATHRHPLRSSSLRRSTTRNCECDFSSVIRQIRNTVAPLPYYESWIERKPHQRFLSIYTPSGAVFAPCYGSPRPNIMSAALNVICVH